MNYIRITKENIDKEHICCAMSGKQSVAKKEWLKQHFDDGLVFYRSEELADYGIKSSTTTVGDSYDNTLAETVNGLYKTELIYSQAWRSCTEVEWATMNWVHWWNNTRLHEPLGYTIPKELITNYNQHRARELTHV